MRIIKEVKQGYRGPACLVEHDGKYFVVSGPINPRLGFSREKEVLVFRADEDGRVTDWLDVAGGIGVSREGAMHQLAQKIEKGEL